MQRRHALQFAGLLGSLAAAGAMPAAAASDARRLLPRAPDGPQFLRMTIFSRHLQWLTTQDYAHTHPYETGVAIGEAAREIGFNAVDLTVRGTGHVDLARADFRVNLPRMLAGLRSTGATCDHITTNIVDADAPIATFASTPIFARELLAVAAGEGIRRYRWGGFSYSNATDPATGRAQPFGDQVLDQLDAFAARVRGLWVLNQRYGMLAMYHTFSGGNNARSTWDLMHVLRQFPIGHLSMNYDIGHLVTESALSAWRTNLRYALPMIGGVGLKDALVQRNANGTVGSTWMLAGTGMVQWREFFQLLLEGGYAGPAEAQYEYNTTGVNGAAVNMNTTFWADHSQFLSGNLNRSFMVAELRKDLTTYRLRSASRG